MPEPSSINPYAAPGESQIIEPIQFQGTMTVDDVRASAMPLEVVKPVTRWLGRAIGIVTLCFLAIVLVQGWARAEPISPLYWTFGACVATFVIWLPAVMYGLNHWGNGGARVKRLLDRTKAGLMHRRGWLDANGLTIWSEGLAAKMKWECFTNGEVWPDMIRLVDALDDRQRIVLPWNHFESAGDFLSVQTLLKERGAQSIREAPLPDHIHEKFGDLIHAFDFTTADADQWAVDAWPPNADQTEHHDFVVLLSGDKSWTTLIATMILEGVLGSLILFFPFLAAGVLWLLYEFRVHGDWNFLVDNFLENLLFVGPLAGVIIVISLFMFNQFSTILKRVSPPSQFSLTPRGVYSKIGENEFWWDWSAMHVAEMKKGRMVLHVTTAVNPIALSERMFESSESFDRFVALVERFRVS